MRRSEGNPALVTGAGGAREPHAYMKRAATLNSLYIPELDAVCRSPSANSLAQAYRQPSQVKVCTHLCRPRSWKGTIPKRGKQGLCSSGPFTFPAVCIRRPLI